MTPMARPDDWLYRANFHPALENSRQNPFLREHLPAEDIRPLERASIAAGWAYPSGLTLLFLGIGTIGPLFHMVPAWLEVATAWFYVAAGATLLFFGMRGHRRIDAAWRKALQHCDEAAEAAEDARRAQVLAEMNRPRV
jgi:hypothetical protein